MTTPGLRSRGVVVLAVAALALASRLWVWCIGADLHPDEFFQYLEPTWWHLHGYGWPAWEWAEGLRSWVIPAYHGAWIVVFQWLQIRDPRLLHQLILLHWALFNLSLVWFAWNASDALVRRRSPGEETFYPRLFAALLTGTLPMIAYFAPHTLTEVMSTPFLVGGLTFWVRGRLPESRSSQAGDRRVHMLAGLLLALGACIRIPHLPVLAIPFFDLLLRRQFRTMGWMTVGALPAIVLFGGVDWATWGTPWQSSVAIIRWNIVEGRAVENGSSPLTGYVVRVWELFGVSLPLLLLPLLLGARITWPFIVPAALIFALLSSQHHQEDRYTAFIWPCVTIAWGTTLGAWVERLRQRGGRNVVAWSAATLAALVIVACNAYGIRNRPLLDYTRRHGLYDGQSWVGARGDATGLLVEGRFHLSGGYFRVGKNIPLDTFRPDLVENPIFNYVVVRKQSPEATFAERVGFVAARAFDDFVVMRR